MYKIYLVASVLSISVTICFGLVLENNLAQAEDDVISHGLRTTRQIPDECRPFGPPQHHHHHHHHPHHNSEEEHGKMQPDCCVLPNALPAAPEASGKCHDIIFGQGRGNSRGHQGKHAKKDKGKFYESSLQETKRAKRGSEETTATSNSEESRENSTSTSGFQDKKECFMNCVFNISGLLLADEMLNEEILNQKLLEDIANDTKWASIVDPIFKKCIAAAKEANSQSQKSCKPGASEYVKCMTRELFFNCPTEIWVNSTECDELKNKLQKCPNLSPFPKLRSQHVGRRHRSHSSEENHS